jgi:ferredoxin
VGIDPLSAGKWAFWSEMGSSTVDKGFDLWLTDIGGNYLVEIGTQKGEELLKLAKTTAAIESDIKKRDELRGKLASLCKADRKLKKPVKELYSLFKKNYDSKLWEERAKKCYSCGSCNLVCPTCYCFDVRENVDLSLTSGQRERFWDGCLLEDFAMVGHGENFREDRSARYRHRLLRKMEYMVDKIGETACVGCGRCSSVCLPDIADPVKIIRDL